jgi:CBS domain-containing protein
MSIADTIALFTAHHDTPTHKSYPIVDDGGKLVGIVSRSDALRWTVEGWPTAATLGDWVDGQTLVSGYDDELVGQLADRMAAADVARVPIVQRSDEALVGLVARRDLLLVRANLARQERERSALIQLRPRPRAAEAR